MENTNVKEKPRVLTMQPMKNGNSGKANNSGSNGYINIVALIGILLVTISFIALVSYRFIAR